MSNIIITMFSCLHTFSYLTGGGGFVVRLGSGPHSVLLDGTTRGPHLALQHQEIPTVIPCGRDATKYEVEFDRRAHKRQQENKSIEIASKISLKKEEILYCIIYHNTGIFFMLLTFFIFSF